MKTIILLLLLSLCVPSRKLCAQDACSQQAARLNAQASRPATQWTPADQAEMVGGMLHYYQHCLLWNPELHQMLWRNLPSREGNVTLAPDDLPGQTPVNRNGTLVFPKEYVVRLIALGMLLTHDATVRGGHIEYPQELRSTPYRVAAVIPLLDPIAPFLEPAAFMNLATGLQCPAGDSKCLGRQMYGGAAPILFVLLHENAHTRLGHRVTDRPDLQQELDADRSALTALNALSEAVVTGMDPDLATDVRWMFRAAPALWLSVENSVNENKDSGLAARLAAVLSSYGGDRDDFVAELQPARGTLQTRMTKFRLDRPYRLLAADDVLLLPEQIPADGLLTTAGPHTYLVAGNEGLALGRGISTVSFTFYPFEDVPADRMQTYSNSHRWGELLAATLNSSLQPRRPEFRPLCERALRRLGVSLASCSTAQTAATQPSLSIPLASWRKSAE